MPQQQDNETPNFTPIYLPTPGYPGIGTLPAIVPPPTQETNNNLVGPEQPD